MHDTTFRNTMAKDTVHYRGYLAPANVKHGIIDPSHTFTMPPYHHTRRKMDFMNYDKKGKRDNKSETLQYVTRETHDFNGTMILRLPEERDFVLGWEKDPVDKFLDQKKDNQEYFKKSAEERLDLSQFGRNNYLTAPKNHVGVASHLSYNIGS